MAVVRLSSSRIFLARRVQAQLEGLPADVGVQVQLVLENLGALVDAGLPPSTWLEQHPRQDGYFVADTGGGAGVRILFDVDAAAGVVLVARLEGPGVPKGAARTTPVVVPGGR